MGVREDLESVIWEVDPESAPVVLQDDSARIRKEWMAAMTPRSRARRLSNFAYPVSRRNQRRLLASGKVELRRCPPS